MRPNLRYPDLLRRTMPLLQPCLAGVAALVALALPAFAQEFKAGGITVTVPWVRATPGGAMVAGAYLGIRAAAGADDKLISARSPTAGAVEIHDHIDDAGIMRMRRVDGIPMKSGESVTLRPGGLHLMLMDLKQPFKAGDTIELTLVFEKAGEVQVTAKVAPIGSAGPDGTALPGAGSGSGSGSGN